MLVANENPPGASYTRGAICTSLAGINWTKSPQLSISSIALQRTDTK
jgi:hypothetical protein